MTTDQLVDMVDDELEHLRRTRLGDLYEEMSKKLTRAAMYGGKVNKLEKEWLARLVAKYGYADVLFIMGVLRDDARA